MLDAMTQGRTEEEALVMAKDMVETLTNRPGFSVTVHSCGGGDIELGSDDARSMVALMLRRQRTRSVLEALPDDQIDTSDISEVRDWSDARRGLFHRPAKRQIRLRLDADVVNWFKGQTPDG